MAYEGVSNYCHSTYDWRIAKENPSIMYVQMGEETDSAYQVVFRSYTGTFVNFYVDKTSGTTRMEEYVPHSVQKKEKSDEKTQFYCIFLIFGSKFMSFSDNSISNLTLLET